MPRLAKIPEPPADRPDSEWLTRSQLLEYLQIATSRLSQLRVEWGNCYERGSGPSLRIHGPSFVRRFFAEREAAAQEKAKASSPDDELSEYDKVWKQSRAEKSRLELEKFRGELIDFEAMMSDLDEFTGLLNEGISNACEMCQDIMQAKLDEAREHFGVTERNGHHLNGHAASNGRAK